MLSVCSLDTSFSVSNIVLSSCKIFLSALVPSLSLSSAFSPITEGAEICFLEISSYVVHWNGLYRNY